MKFVTNLFRGKTASLEEGPAKYRSTNEYYVLHRDESRTHCGRLAQIVKVILCIELIILIGWLGCVSFPYFVIDQNSDCRESAFGCKTSQIDYDDIEVKNNRGSRSVGDTEDGPAVSQLTIDCRDAETQLMEERRERLEVLADDVANDRPIPFAMRQLLTSIESALNHKSPSEVTVEDAWLQENSGLIPWKRFVSEASLQLKREFYELVRDEFLELQNANDQSSAWGGYDLEKLYKNWTDGLDTLMKSESPEAVLNITIKFGSVFNLHYVKAEKKDSSGDSEAPAFGTLTYLDAEPERPGVRRLRHILNGFVRLYFRVINRLGPCQPAAGETPTRNRRFVQKRFATSEPIPKPVTATCWNEEEEDRVLLEERRVRQEIFAKRGGLGYEYELQEQQMFLEGIDKALNATSTSEIRFENELMEQTMVLPSIQYLVANASLKLQKEGYELARDLFMEMHGLNHRGPEWEGWNQDYIARNLTNAIFFSKLNITSQSIFDNFVRFGEAFNLRYEKSENRASENAPYGKFTNLGKEPEKLGVRHLRHTLDSFVRLYYKIQNPSTPSVCSSTVQTRAKRSIEKRFVTQTPIRMSADLTCWSKEQDNVLLEERRARLETFQNKKLKDDKHDRFTQNYLEGLAAALNATRITEIHFDQALVDSTPILRFMNYLLTNSSLELHKEGYEIIRDMYLEMLELRAHSSEWDGYDEQSINENMTALGIPGNVKMNSESIFNGIVKFGIPFNLHYQELANRDSEDEPDKPVFGKLTYVGDEPEKLGVRHLRHILDGFVKLYFRIQDPSTLMVCNLNVQPSAEGGEGGTPTRDERSVEKRSVTAEPVPESTTTKCWSEEEDKILEEERRERLAAFAIRTNAKVMDISYAKAYLEDIEAALNATSISEIHFADNLPKAKLLRNMESFCENSSLDEGKECYEIIRDLYLEFYELKKHSPEWDGYDMERIHNNLTASHIFSDNMTNEAIFNDIVKFSNTFNLRYEELGNRESGAEPNKPVFGKFAYVGEGPEKLGIRHLRHILDAVVKFYFKRQDPSSVCKNKTSTTPLTPASTDAECWNMEQDPVLLEERRERLEAYATWKAKTEEKMLLLKTWLDTIDKVLNASSVSEIHFDDQLSTSAPMLSVVQDFAMNHSLELCKEVLEIARDLWLEIDELEDHTSAWEGYDLKTILKNLTDTRKADGSIPTLEIMFDELKIFGRLLNLSYEEIKNGDGGDKTDKPVLGKFTYVGEEPEKLGVRRMRHIFDGFVRVYFKVRHPSIAPVCNSTGQTHAEHSVKKRDVTADPVPESITAKCWSEEEDKILEEERLERLGAYVFRMNEKEMESSYTKAQLEGIEAALNATSISEIHFNDNFRKAPLLKYIESLCENSSLDIRKEGYLLFRDFHLELNKLQNHHPEWNGYNLDRIVENATGNHIFSVNMTKEAMFNNILTFSNAFNLRYEELGNRESGAEPNKPVFGKFAYLGEQPENLGIRHLRHIFDALVKFYFKTQEPSSVCKDKTSTTTLTPEPSNAECWNMEQDPVLLEERRERLEAYAIWKAKTEEKMLFSKTYLDTLGEVLSASSTSDIHFDENLSKSMPLLSFIQDVAMNSSLDLCKEGLEISRDIFLEIDALEDHTPEWEGYDLETIQKNFTETGASYGSIPTLEIMFDNLKTFGRSLNLRYEEIENGDGGEKTDKPVLGKFTYLGEEPEKLGVRHMRHILDGFARFHFKVRHPSIAPVCNSTGQTHAEHSVKKRAVTADPVPESITTKCWSKEQDKMLEERRERLADFAIRKNDKERDISWTMVQLEVVEVVLNATSISEIHFDDHLPKAPLLEYLESLWENSSLDIRKEGYSLFRDFHLEMNNMQYHRPEWKGSNIKRIVDNITDSHVFENMNKKATFNDIVTFGNAYNLRYEELGNRESGAELNKPVFGKFAYLGEQPESLGMRHLRHIFDGIVKLYFKTQEPSSVCNDTTSTTTLIPEPTNAKCWNMEQDPVLLEERRERLEAYATWKARTEAKMLFAETYLDTLGEALNASSASEIHFDEKWSRSVPLLSFIQNLAMNYSLELCKEGLEIARDIWLEIDALEDHTPEWEGYDLETIQNNLTDTSDSDGSIPTPEIMFDDLKKFGRPLNLRYEEIENGDSGDKTDKPVLGKFTYVGEEPEKLGVRHMRHILDSFARFYFKVRHPSIAQVCNSSVEGGENTNTG